MSFQSQALTWGSRSMRATCKPQLSASTARLMAVVVLDVPPFWQMRETTFMETFLHRYLYTCKLIDLLYSWLVDLQPIRSRAPPI